MGKIQTLVFLSLNMIHKWLSKLNLQGEFLLTSPNLKYRNVNLALTVYRGLGWGWWGRKNGCDRSDNLDWLSLLTSLPPLAAKWLSAQDQARPDFQAGDVHLNVSPNFSFLQSSQPPILQSTKDAERRTQKFHLLKIPPSSKSKSLICSTQCHISYGQMSIVNYPPPPYPPFKGSQKIHTLWGTNNCWC